MKLIVFASLLLASSFSNGRPSRNYLNEDDDIIGNDPVEIFKKWVKNKRIELMLPENGELFEGDMVMNSRLRRAVLGSFSKRSALLGTGYKWSGGIVPYEVDLSLIPRISYGIHKAFKEYEKHTCVRFVPRTDQKDYVVFRSEPHKCSSTVGRSGGPQNVTLGAGCRQLGTILHEMMHCLGVVHEQSRPDRDKHVIVLKENIEKKYLHNFQKYEFYDVTDLDVPYNYASIMHYRNTAFSKNGEPTLMSRRFPGLKFGQRKMFSKGDIEQINKLYDCKLKQNDNGFTHRLFKNPEPLSDRDLIPNKFDESADEFSVFNF